MEGLAGDRYLPSSFQEKPSSASLGCSEGLRTLGFDLGVEGTYTVSEFDPLVKEHRMACQDASGKPASYWSGSGGARRRLHLD